MSDRNLPVIVAASATDRPATSERSAHVRRGTDVALIRSGRSTKLLTHGIYSTAHVKEEILDEVSTLYARCSWLDPVVHGPVVESLGRMLVRLRRLDQALDGPEPSRDMLALAARLEGQVRLTCESLGMTPRSQAALGLQKLSAVDAASRAEAYFAREFGPKKPKKRKT